MPWSKKKFLSLLSRAHAAERSWVTHRREEGLAVAHGLKVLSPHANPKESHCLNPDAVALVDIEVKVRSLKFSGPNDWPHDTVFVDDMHGLTKGRYPFAWVYISKLTGSWVWLSSLDIDDSWVEEIIYDGMRKYEVPTLICPNKFLRHADELRSLILGTEYLERIEGTADAFRDSPAADGESDVETKTD